MSASLEQLREARARGDVRAMIAAIPYARFLGLDLELADDELRGVLRYSDALIGDPTLPALHGGTIGALLENTALLQIAWDIDLVALPKTISFTIAYLRSGKPRDVYARATITRQGRRVANVQVEAWQEERARPIATAAGQFLIQSAPRR
ncbi:MAG: PaaI family thioesterase [Myxococcales bacterium]|nr:PaaI family thioesterase [Myxococcales bacterium]